MHHNQNTSYERKIVEAAIVVGQGFFCFLSQSHFAARCQLRSEMKKKLPSLGLIAVDGVFVAFCF